MEVVGSIKHGKDESRWCMTITVYITWYVSNQSASLSLFLSGKPIFRRVPSTRRNGHPQSIPDIWCLQFGVLLSEILTWKSPIHTAGGDEVIHLVRWVHSVVREEWTAEVFDLELLKFPNIEEEMVEMLQIGMACASRVPEQRPQMLEVVKMVEDIRRINTGSQPASATISEGSTPTFISWNKTIFDSRVRLLYRIIF